MGCFAIIPDEKHKIEIFMSILEEKNGFNVKSVEEAGKYIYIGITEEKKYELA